VGDAWSSYQKLASYVPQQNVIQFANVIEKNFFVGVSLIDQLRQLLNQVDFRHLLIKPFERRNSDFISSSLPMCTLECFIKILLPKASCH
jgi:hypothetical protein